MSIFKRTGFDSLISKGTTLSGTLTLEGGTTTVLDGTMNGERITVEGEKPATLMINGGAVAMKDVTVENLIITGTLTCETLTCAATLAIKNGARVTAKKILYRGLVVEPKAMIFGEMQHLDGVQAAENVEA